MATKSKKPQKKVTRGEKERIGKSVASKVEKKKEPAVVKDLEVKKGPEAEISLKRTKLKVEKDKKPLMIKERKIKKEVKSETLPKRPDRGALMIGGGLVVLGAVLLLGELFGFSFGEFLWPFIFIVPGILIFVSALSLQGGNAEGLAVFGSILTMLGLVFFTQTVFDLWASWAYAWALIAPTSIGLGQMIYGTHKGQESIVRAGRNLVNIGLTIFVVGFVFFELIIGLDGFGLASFGLPAIPIALILIGILILVHALIHARK